MGVAAKIYRRSMSNYLRRSRDPLFLQQESAEKGDVIVPPPPINKWSPKEEGGKTAPST